MEVGNCEVEVKLEGYMAPKQNLTIQKDGSNEVGFIMRDRSSLPTAVGQAYGGGIIFEVSADGQGLVVAMEDFGERNWKQAKGQCESYQGGGHTDWYLPSKNELTKLYKVVEVVNNSLKAEGGQGIKYDTYWSSTEFDSNAAWTFLFYNGNANYYYNKDNTYYVRAVRAF